MVGRVGALQLGKRAAEYTSTGDVHGEVPSVVLCVICYVGLQSTPC